MRFATTWRTHRSSIIAVLFVTTFGAIPRLFFALVSRFPLNDGGMLYAMIRDLWSSGYSLPAYTSYNGGSIPFVYPPLGLYLAGGISSLLHVSLLDCLRLLPPSLSVLTIPAFFLFSQALLENEVQTTLASLAFATIPTAFDWGIMGGGLTRSLGFVFALLTLQQIVGLLRHPQPWRIAGISLTATGTLLSHPSTTWFAVYSALILSITYGRNRKALGYLMLSGGAALLLSSPWWLTVVRRHGVSPFLAASGSAGTPLSSFIAAPLLQFTNQPLLAIWPVVGLVGLLLCINRRIWLLPGWTLIVALIQGRGWPAFIDVPFGVMAGIGLAGILSLVGGSRRPDFEAESAWPEILDGIAPKLGLAYIGVMTLLAATIAAPKTSLTHSQLDAMAWARQHTPPESTFAVISGRSDWSGDANDEWFPALAQRISVATPQGREWEPNEFARRQADYAGLQACASQTTACLDRWAQIRGGLPEYIYLVDVQASAPLNDSLNSSSDFQSVFESSGVRIFARR